MIVANINTLKGDGFMNLLETIKEKYKELAGRKANSSGNVPAEDLKPIPALKKKIDDCTKEINDAIEKRKEKECFTNMLKKFSKDLKKSLDKVDKEQELDNWDFYRICRLLEMAVMQWCTSSPPFSKEIMLYILIGLTGKKQVSFFVNSPEKAEIVIKESDKSVNNEVKKSLEDFLTALMDVYCYFNESKGEIKEFKRKEVLDKNSDGGSEISRGAMGSVRKIQYIGKNGKTKTRAVKTLNAMFFEEGDRSKGLLDEGQNLIKGSALVEDTFKTLKRKYKELKKINRELKRKSNVDDDKKSGVDDDKLKEYNEIKNKIKSKFSNLALQKVRTIGNEIVMISKFAKGNLMDFFIKKHEYKLDNKEKIRKLFGDLTAGVSQLHEMGLVHGDIKPENILVYQTKKGDLKYKLTDFDGVLSVENYEGNSIHTVDYLPEFYRQNKIPNGEVAKRVDCYAICMTLRQIFSSIENFGGENPQSLQKYAEGLVAKYEKEHSCSKDSFKQEPSPKESSSLNS